MIKEILKNLFFPLPEEKPLPRYKFNLGDLVDIYNGWERPISTGLVQNRQIRIKKLRASSGLLQTYHIPYYMVNGQEYDERCLRKTPPPFKAGG